MGLIAKKNKVRVHAMISNMGNGKNVLYEAHQRHSTVNLCNEISGAHAKKSYNSVIGPILLV